MPIPRIDKKNIVAALLFLAGFWACKKGAEDVPFKGFQKPSNFPDPAYRFTDNEVTRAGFELGRKLFYDPILSQNGTISCGSCHVSYAAFCHPGHRVSHGIHDLLGTRNAPPIMNLAWNTAFMWDGGIFDLDLQPLAPITNHVEMDDTLSNVLAKLRKTSVYPPLFEQAFGSNAITGAPFLKALSQFMTMCVSSRSRYDSVIRKEGPRFNDSEQQGYAVFQKECASCHREPLFTDQGFSNNGLPITTQNDLGRYSVTLRPADSFLFKVPSLRNLGYTAPYMHDGRFSTLESVLDHYANGMANTPYVDKRFVANGRVGVTLSGTDKQNLLAFLKTLDDRAFVTDRELAEQ